jgi:hypothetical protein
LIGEPLDRELRARHRAEADRAGRDEQREADACDEQRLGVVDQCAAERGDPRAAEHDHARPDAIDERPEREPREGLRGQEQHEAERDGGDARGELLGDVHLHETERDERRADAHGLHHERAREREPARAGGSHSGHGDATHGRSSV